jgi:hypothetical protein
MNTIFHIFILALFISIVTILDILPLQYLIMAGLAITIGLRIHLVLTENYVISRIISNVLLDQTQFNRWWSLFIFSLACTIVYVIGWEFGEWISLSFLYGISE